jgi:hypothetical protein
VRRLEQGSIYKEIWKMKAISVLKAQAKNLQAALAAQGIPVKLGQAQELIAQQYGHPNWDTVAGILNAPEPEPRAPRLSDMPGMPDSVRVERGVRGAMFDGACGRKVTLPTPGSPCPSGRGGMA